MASISCSIAPGFILLVIASLLAVTQANTVVVGGSENWRYGFNYTDWAIKNSPFYIQDTLVFKYEPPHNVYLLPNLWSYLTCDFSKAKLLANPKQGRKDGFAVVINQWRPYYFASGQGDDCKIGMMKFVAVPWPRLTH
ncbi:hypothetical protein SLA2020_308380 [Shorea laevis]